MSDNKPDSEQTSLVNRTVTAGATVSSTDHEAWRNDIEGRIDDLIAGLKDNSNHRAGTSAPTDNAVECQVWGNTTTNPAKLYADLDGAGADTQIITTDDSASATAEGISELATIAEVNTGTDTGRTITPAGLKGSIFTAGLATKIVEIGDWDMNATTNVDVAHGLTLANIRTVSVMVRNDTGGSIFHYTGGSGAGGATANNLWVGVITATNVTLYRLVGSAFDDPDFGDTGYNRGWIVIQYVP